MNKEDAVKILRAYNKWRRDGRKTMPKPQEIGMAIDVAIQILSEPTKQEREINKIKAMV